MSETKSETIPIHASQSTQFEIKPVAKRKRNLGGRIAGFFLLIFYFTLVGGVGWGVWLFCGPSSQIKNDAVLAELDGFEAAPVFSTPSKIEAVETAELPVPDPGTIDLPPVFPSDVVAVTNQPINPPVDAKGRNESAASKHAWLTGTIEEADPAFRQQSPQRISGGASDLSTIR